MDESDEPTGVSVHTGFPNPAADKRLQTLDLNQLLIEHGASTFFFRVRGDEWQSVGILDGDIAIVDRALDARKTDLVIWWRDGPEHFQISACKDVPEDATTWGVVTAIIHQFRKVNPR